MTDEYSNRSFRRHARRLALIRILQHRLRSLPFSLLPWQNRTANITAPSSTPAVASWDTIHLLPSFWTLNAFASVWRGESPRVSSRVRKRGIDPGGVPERRTRARVTWAGVRGLLSPLPCAQDRRRDDLNASELTTKGRNARVRRWQRRMSITEVGSDGEKDEGTRTGTKRDGVWATVARKRTQKNGGETGPICLLFSEAGRWHLYDAESDAKRKVCYKTSEQKGERKEGKEKIAFAGNRPARR